MPSRSITSRVTSTVTSAAVRLLAPASRAIAPSAASTIKHISASLPRKQLPQPLVILEFTSGWSEEGKVLKWYSSQPQKSFTSLEYRKERGGIFKHEFIVVRFDNNTLCRFDRRPKEDDRIHALRDEGTTAEDTAHILWSWQHEFQRTERESDMLLHINFPQGEDLLLILAICYSIRTNTNANPYSLTRYNCYFFSWTVVSIAARRAAEWGKVAQSEEQWSVVAQAALDKIDTEMVGSKPSVRSKRPFRSSLRRLVPRFMKKKETHVPSEDSDNALSAKNLQDTLQPLLFNIRFSAGDTLHKLLFRTQLAPAMEALMDEQVKVAVLEAKVIACERRATLIAISEVSSPYTKPEEPGKFGELSWSDHCDLAWAVATEAAFAATVATIGDGAQPNVLWDTAWDVAWQQHWDGKVPTGGDTPDARSLGNTASRRAKRAWKEQWDAMTDLTSEHVSEMAAGAAKCLLDHLPDIDASRLAFGHDRLPTSAIWKGKAVARTQEIMGIGPRQPSLQDYIRDRMYGHCKMVENYGFGTYDNVLTSIETTMCEVWLKTLDVLENGLAGPPAR